MSDDLAQLGLDEGAGRIPPHDMLAEQSVVGAILLGSKQALDDVSEQMRPDDFYQPRHEVILTSALALTARGLPVDVVTVGDELQRTGKVAQAGGHAYLHHCASVVITPANAGYYAGIVAEKAVLRRLVEAGTRIVEMGYASEGDTSALVEHARAEVDGVSSKIARSSEPIGSLIEDLAAQLEEKPELTPTPWPRLDGIIGGFRPGALYVIAARPGKGKSALAAQMGVELAKRGPVGFLSLEMGRMAILQRLVSMLGEVPLPALVNHQMTQTDWNSFARVAAPVLRGLPLHVEDAGGWTMTQVASYARSLHRDGGMQGLIVDYLGLLKTDGQHRERHLEVASITRACKELATALGVPVILLSQLNRQGIARGKGKETPPVLTDLRESGAIEQDSDVVVLLHREDRSSVLEVNVAKNRHGPTDRFELKWEGRFVRAVSKEWSATALIEEGKWHEQ